MSISPIEDNQPEALAKKQSDLLVQERVKDTLQKQEAEITRTQLSLRKRLLNWRTLLPLAVVVIAIVYFVQKSHIDPQATWAAIHSANIAFLLAAFVIYYLSFPLRA